MFTLLACNLDGKFPSFPHRQRPTDESTQPTRFERIARLHSVLSNNEKIQAAQSGLATVFTRLQEAVSGLYSRTPSVEQLRDLSNLFTQFQSAALVMFPTMADFLGSKFTQARELLGDMQQVG